MLSDVHSVSTSASTSTGTDADANTSSTSPNSTTDQDPDPAHAAFDGGGGGDGAFDAHAHGWELVPHEWWRTSFHAVSWAYPPSSTGHSHRPAVGKRHPRPPLYHRNLLRVRPLPSILAQMVRDEWPGARGVVGEREVEEGEGEAWGARAEQRSSGDGEGGRERGGEVQGRRGQLDLALSTGLPGVRAAEDSIAVYEACVGIRHDAFVDLGLDGGASVSLGSEAHPDLEAHGVQEEAEGEGETEPKAKGSPIRKLPYDYTTPHDELAPFRAQKLWAIAARALLGATALLSCDAPLVFPEPQPGAPWGLWDLDADLDGDAQDLDADANISVKSENDSPTSSVPSLASSSTSSSHSSISSSLAPTAPMPTPYFEHSTKKSYAYALSRTRSLTASPAPSKPLNAGALSFVPSTPAPAPAHSCPSPHLQFLAAPGPPHSHSSAPPHPISSPTSYVSPAPADELAFPSLAADNPAASPAARVRARGLAGAGWERDGEGFWHPVPTSRAEATSSRASVQSVQSSQRHLSSTPSRPSPQAHSSQSHSSQPQHGLLPAFLGDTARRHGRGASRTRQIVDRLRSGRKALFREGTQSREIGKQKDGKDKGSEKHRVQFDPADDGWIADGPSEDGWIAGPTRAPSPMPSSPPSPPVHPSLLLERVIQAVSARASTPTPFARTSTPDLNLTPNRTPNPHSNLNAHPSLGTTAPASLSAPARKPPRQKHRRSASSTSSLSHASSRSSRASPASSLSSLSAPGPCTPRESAHALMSSAPLPLMSPAALMSPGSTFSPNSLLSPGLYPGAPLPTHPLAMQAQFQAQLQMQLQLQMQAQMALGFPPAQPRAVPMMPTGMPMPVLYATPALGGMGARKGSMGLP
ncbi:hypothetical protein AcV7_002017 [Taiwanofungus camphoratus]|nr:hypothetical protein AcV7_002017 [Antrodia cinnamomea]